jgi:hypothetical protein
MSLFTYKNKLMVYNGKIQTTSGYYTDNLVTWWKFDGNADDEYGNYDGIVHGATYTTDGKIDGCYYFDGNDDYIDVGDAGKYSSNDNFSITAWILANNTGRFFSRRGSYEIHPHPSRETLLFYDGSWEARGTKNIVDGEWHHIGIVIDSDVSKVTLYVDGEVDLSPTDVSFSAGGSDAEIGSWNNGSNNQLDGKIDDFRIYESKLTDKNIETIYNNTK